MTSPRLLWTTVENVGMTIDGFTSENGAPSPIHRPYNNNTKVLFFFVGRPE